VKIAIEKEDKSKEEEFTQSTHQKPTMRSVAAMRMAAGRMRKMTLIMPYKAAGASFRFISYESDQKPGSATTILKNHNISPKSK